MSPVEQYTFIHNFSPKRNRKTIQKVFHRNSKKKNFQNINISKEIGDEEPCYSTKISILSFIWAGLAALHKARYNIMKVVQS